MGKLQVVTKRISTRLGKKKTHAPHITICKIKPELNELS